jgi:NAD(P)-dependent dehydrogenase (short-subunit alcohol dehydrogenase family)
MALAGFAGRRVLLTGAASGIGAATALAAGRRGAELHLTDVDGAGLKRTAAAVAAAGGSVGSVRALDLRDHDAVLALAADLHAAGGPMAAVMNIAGVSTWGAIERLGHEDWREVIEINLIGPISVLEAFVPAMIEAGRGGHLVNVSSAAGFFGLPWHAPYSASKFGLRGVSEVLRFDLRRHRIGVSLVAPGGVRTPLVQSVKIVGVDRENPRIRKLVERFERHAVAPETVATKILDGVEADRPLIFTSADIRALYWAQRLCTPLYELIMRRLNDHLLAAAGEAAKAEHPG